MPAKKSGQFSVVTVTGSLPEIPAWIVEDCDPLVDDGSDLVEPWLSEGYLKDDDCSGPSQAKKRRLSNGVSVPVSQDINMVESRADEVAVDVAEVNVASSATGVSGVDACSEVEDDEVSIVDMLNKSPVQHLEITIDDDNDGVDGTESAGSAATMSDYTEDVDMAGVQMMGDSDRESVIVESVVDADSSVLGLSQTVRLDSSSVLLVTEPRFRLYVWGSFNLRVVQGSLEIHGVRLTARRHALTPVYSLAMKALSAIVSTDADDRSEVTFKAALHQLHRCCTRQLPPAAERALRATGDGCAFVVQRHCFGTLKRLARVHPDVFVPTPPPTPVKSSFASDPLLLVTGCRLISSPRQLQRLPVVPFVEDESWRPLVQQILEHTQPDGARVVIAGGKGVGKSSLLCYMVNSMRNTLPAVYVLDVDPGQSEFTPCACVSLVRVEQSLLGPPFTHITKPIRCLYTGCVSVADDPGGYMLAIKSLLDFYRNNVFDKSTPLIVNTMGWANGLGEDILVEILVLLQPTDVIELFSPLKVNANFATRLTPEATSWRPRNFLLQQSLPTAYASSCRPASLQYRHHLLTSQRPPDTDKRTAFTQLGMASWALRKLNTTACIGALENVSVKLHQVTPKNVSWSLLAVDITGDVGGSVLYEHVMAAINATVVTLCSTDKSLWVPPPATITNGLPAVDPTLFHTLPRNYTALAGSPPVCLGYGLIRGFDAARRLLFVLTDLSLLQLTQVNTVIRGPHHLMTIFDPHSWAPRDTADRKKAPLDAQNHRVRVPRHGTAPQ